ncbi:hypothetical protein F5882DRAFT_307201, partial [Hyaloscypha sp. PMI_1271]
PLGLVTFREKGSFEFDLPEILFDMDYPGHYMRRITSVCVTVPCVVDYLPSTDGDDERFSVLNVPITSVALSSAQNDSGRHELSMTDRYNPFEGAGVISRWRFELPESFRSFDYSTIADVILTLRYTALDGGDKLKAAAARAVSDNIKSIEDAQKDTGLFTLFDLKAEFASEWNSAFRPGSTVAQMRLNNLSDRLPVFTKRTKPERITTLNILLVGRGETLDNRDVGIVVGEQTVDFKPHDGIGDGLLVVTSGYRQVPVTDWVLNIKGPSMGVERLWVVVRYALT